MPSLGPNDSVNVQSTSPLARVAIRRVCEASALVLLALILPSGSVQASCGDYVHVDGMHTEALHDSPGSRDSGSPACQGPHCRRQRPPAAPEDPVSLKAGSTEWLDWRAAVEERDQRRGALVGQILPGLAAGHYRALERPPR